MTLLLLLAILSDPRLVMLVALMLAPVVAK